MLGGQAHNSSAWPGLLPQLWTTIESMHANTLEIPVYWQQVEPQEGTFDFSIVETIIDHAREHQVRLVLLWFGTWKNSNTDYTPDWIKLNPKKYPHMLDREGMPVGSPSPFAKATMEADAKALTAVMRHLKDFDQQHTVIMVQVENEPGTYGCVRDYSPVAQKLFDSPVPSKLLRPEVLKALKKPANAKGTWHEVFGSDADEYFHAWSVASYINYVAEAGKTVNPLPMYVNVALRDPLSNPPASSYESGGATDNVIPIYKAAAPDIDLVASDIDQPMEKAIKVMELYDRPDNALFVPETFGSVDYLYEVIRRGGIGFSPFGVDRGEPNPKAETAPGSRVSALAVQYTMLHLADGELAKWILERRIHVAEVSEQNARQVLDLGGWEATISFGSKGRPVAPPPPQPPAAVASAAGFGNQAKPTGRVLIAQLGDNEFVVLATQCRVGFQPAGANKGKPWQFLKVEEGRYESGAFKLLRLRNGDEVG